MRLLPAFGVEEAGHIQVKWPARVSQPGSLELMCEPIRVSGWEQRQYMPCVHQVSFITIRESYFCRAVVLNVLFVLKYFYF